MDVEELRRRAADRLPLVLRDRPVPPRAALGVALLVGAAATVLTARLLVLDAGASVVLPARQTSQVSAGSFGSARGASAGGAVSRPVGGSAVSTSASAGGAVDGGVDPVASGGVTEVVVDVVGRVRRAGLVRLPAGARVADALRAAGGASAGAALDRLNLARRLVDGEQVVVPGAHDPLPSPAGPTGPGDPSAGGTNGTGEGAVPLDLNAATAAELDGLPGVGPVLAGRIVAWRSAHQRFSRVEELGEVAGIGPKALERLRPLVRV